MFNKKNFDKKFFLLVCQFFFSFLFFFTASIFFAYHLAYANKIIPRTFVGPFNLSNKTPQEAYDYLQPKFEALNKQTITIVINKQNLQTSLKNLGFYYDVKKTVLNAYQAPRSGNFFQNIKAETDAWFNSQKLTPQISLEKETFNAKTRELFSSFEKPVKNAAFTVNNNIPPNAGTSENKNLAITPSEKGFYIDRENLKKEILSQLEKMAFSKIILDPVPEKPKITANNLKPLQEKVKNFVFNPPFFSFQRKIYQPLPEQALSFLDFVDGEKAGVEIAADNEKIGDYVNQLSQKINRQAKGQILEIKNNRVVKFSPSEDGREIEKAKAVKIYSKAVFSYFADGEKIKENGKNNDDGENSGPAALLLELPVKITPAPENPNEYGIKELLGEGVSNYRHSSPGRAYNVALAASKLNGILIAPGQSFYFNRSLGEVSSRTGYRTAWVIKQNRTVLGTGGGVCQVSTTVFRAALNSGLPIIERSAHAYRVSYYEYESAMGFDATVYAPRPDLVFRNDTPAYILITSEVDKKNTRLYFRIYGTSDGRKVEVSGPKIASQTPPPAPLYQDDPSLPKGVIKQIDFSAWGADVSIFRKVYRDGKILQDDVFRSIYKPWRAIYLRGTG